MDNYFIIILAQDLGDYSTNFMENLDAYEKISLVISFLTFLAILYSATLVRRQLVRFISQLKQGQKQLEQGQKQLENSQNMRDMEFMRHITERLIDDVNILRRKRLYHFASLVFNRDNPSEWIDIIKNNPIVIDNMERIINEIDTIG